MKLKRLRKQLNDEGSRYSKITLIQDDTLIHVKTAANLFADTYQQASNIQVTTQQHRETRSQLRIIESHNIAPIAQLVSALDLVTSSVQVEGSILTAGKR